jgi:predicted O-linked N-acetylglucosamine transferase (SPINDLY family)
VSYLAAGVFEHHDRARFHTTAFSIGVDDRGPTRTRLLAGFDAFRDCRGLSDAEVTAAIAAAGIDVLVDLAGHTADGRPRVMAARPAPVQVNWLGYPGTTGAAAHDYILSDAVVIPPPSRRHYAEKVAELPECFQPNDDRRPLPEPPTRRDAGLPEEGFVFCSFNAGYKLNPETFAVWMRLLARVPRSVLWLAVNDIGARDRLRAEAERRGIEGARLVFARRQPYPRHLARLRLADLFLDTLPFNAGTTASDALWAGVPVVTCPGEAFAARMAASLLTALGLSDLVTATLADYEATALALAADSARLADCRARLAGARRTRPLFDTARFTRHLEAAYLAMWERSRRGLAPDHITVPALPR